MKFRIIALSSFLFLLACGQDGHEVSETAAVSSLSPTPSIAKTLKIQGQNAKIAIEILKRSGLQEKSSIESTFIQADQAFCVNGVNPSSNQPIKICQFSVGGGLFVRASAEDSDTFIKLIRQSGAVSKAVTNGKRWDIKNLECSTRFDLATRQLVSLCTFQQ